MFTTITFSLPSVFAGPSHSSKDDGSSHSTRLYEEYAPPESVRNDPKAAGSFAFHGEAAVDIIAVHGLAGTRATSWSVEEEDGERYHWLRSKLPKDLPVARILTFEYNSEWYENPSHVDLEECGAQLLRCIIQDRRHQGELLACPARRKRPIIFIGHSFGGLVVKQTLLYASQTHAWGSTSLQESDFRNHQDIIACTAGVIFLGTPHRGSNFSKLAKAKIFAGSMLGYSTNPDLVDLLELNGTFLTYIRHQFCRLLNAEILKNLQVYCYFEQENMAPLPLVVVTAASACIDGTKRRGLPLNHKQLNKFGSGEDKNYNMVLADILEVVKACSEIVPPRFEAWQYDADGCNSVRESLRRSLNPSREPQITQLESRFKVQKASNYTCQWIFKLPMFEAWRDWSSPQNVLWINGKAGSGKSIMAAYLAKSFREGFIEPRDEDETSVCTVPLTSNPCGNGRLRLTLTILHFFCGVDRTHEEPTSFIGTLIHQLLSQHKENPKLISIAQSVYRENADGVESSVMVKLLVDLIKVVGKVIIIVDGLEEALQMIEKREAYKHFMENLSFVNGNRNVRLLFLSQGIEDIHQELVKGFNFPATIPITDHTQADIHKFVEVEVAELIKRKPKLGSKEQEIVRKLQSGAQGMFQWVSASIGHLLKDVHVPEDVDKSLEDLPQGLTSTYSRMFQRVAKMAPFLQLRVKVVLRWLAVSARPLTALELKVAIMLEDDPKKAIDFIKENKYNYAELVQELRTLLEDLIQIDQLEDSTHSIQLVHPSLRKALTSEISLDNQAITNFKFTDEKAHRGCALACMQLIQHSAFSHANAFGISQAPLVEYAWEFWAYHFKLSAISLKDKDLKEAFDAMILDTTRDAIAFLGALTDFVSSPLERVPGVDGDLAYIVSLQHAQESILPSMKALESVRRNTPLSSELVKAGESVSCTTYTANPVAKAQQVGSWVERKITNFRINVLRTQSAVTNLRTDDYLAKQVQLKSSVQPTMAALWDAARKLRVVALRFAVNPVYGALIAKAGGATFSPIHFLVYIARLLEECGNYPYWDDLPPPFDIMEPFVCGPKDPFAGAARFVLHSFEYRFPVVQEADAKPAITQEPSPKSGRRHRRVRSHSPRPDPRDVGAYQTISADDRRRVQALQEMPGHKYLTAGVAYHLFGVEEDDWRRIIVNPLKNIHMEKVLLLKEDDGLISLEDPGKRLARHAPQSIQTSPLTQYLRSLPVALRLVFARYFAHVAEIFGRFSQYAMARHFARFETAKEELKGVKIYLDRLLNPDDPVRLWHLAPALALFWLRSRLIPSFGAHFSPHSWNEFLFSYKHPAAYLDWQDSMTIWSWCKWLLNYFIARALTVCALTAGLTIQKGKIRDAANIFGGFSIICQLERSVFSMGFMLATLVASARVIFVDQESTAAVASFSFLYWVNTFAGICIGCLHAGTLTRVTEPWHFIVWAISQVVLTILWLIYSRYLWRFLVRVFKGTLYHLTWPIWLVVQAAVKAYVPILKGVGIFLFVYAGFLAMYWMSRWMRDPYDMKSSLSGLGDARRIARSTVEPDQRKRIGQYPLGSTIEASKEEKGFRLSVRAPTLEYENDKEKNKTSDENEQKPIIPEMTSEEMFGLFFGADGVPEKARERSTSNPRLAAAVWDDDVSAEHLFERFFGTGSANATDERPSRSRFRRHSDSAMPGAGVGHAKTE
ncbi:MAG: hypothetical protein M1840_000003 [Geoglossum simile]|nr:MAG: hypothetical protein M1840_000003 [Geoglossum simile]